MLFESAMTGIVTPAHHETSTRPSNPAIPRFWLLLVFNLFVRRRFEVCACRVASAAAVVVMAFLVLGNALLGMWLMWALVDAEPAAAPPRHHRPRPKR